MTDQAGSLSLSYDQRGLVTANARTISSDAYTTGYTYESAGPSRRRHLCQRRLEADLRPRQRGPGHERHGQAALDRAR